MSNRTVVHRAYAAAPVRGKRTSSVRARQTARATARAAKYTTTPLDVAALAADMGVTA